MHRKLFYRVLTLFLATGCVVLPMLHGLTYTTAFLVGIEEKAQRQEKVNAIYSALEDTKQAYGSLPSIEAMREQAELDAKLAEEALEEIGKQKLGARNQLVQSYRARDEFLDRYNIDPTDQNALKLFLERQRPEVEEMLRKYARFQYLTQAQVSVFSVFLDPFVASLDQRILQELYMQTVQSFRTRTFSDAAVMQDFSKTLVGLQEEHDGLLGEYHGALSLLDEAEKNIALSKNRRAEIRRIVAEVENTIREMQVQLAVYDEQLRSRAESALLEKGLLSGPARRASTLAFIWPVVGGITAGYYEPSYQQYFGVPHKGIDIAQSHGSPVYSAADGIVYHVQHGGAYGYSYILIGHMGGYATLYGHLSSIHVAAGDEVYGGQVIGQSGGTPGTVGAGPMTTGAHLHFEVVHNGAHVNPLNVLP